MTAIGAMSAGAPQPTDDDIDALTGDDVMAYTADVCQWLIGPYTGTSLVETLRWRALCLVRIAERTRGRGVFRGDPGAVAGDGLPGTLTVGDVGEGPGSSTDPAYSSPTPVAGDAIEPSVEQREAAAAGGYPVTDEASARRAAEGYEPETPGGSV